MNHSTFSYRKVYGYVAILLMVLLMSWEFQKVDAALSIDAIPEESIRLRILANSDAPADQYIKAIVRDAVVNTMNSWITEPMSVEQARALLQSKEAELQGIIADVLTTNGYNYGFTTTIGQVEFPTKMYGKQVYAAGMYEALLISLGKGEGRNWWCVLFPPLCFTDAVAGEAQSGAMQVSADSNEGTDSEAGEQLAQEHSNEENLQTAENVNEVEVKFFIAELFEDIGAWFGSLFA